MQDRIMEAVRPYQERLTQLEQENARLRTALEAWKQTCRPHPHKEGEYLMLTAEVERSLALADEALHTAREQAKEQGEC